jgi:hypothetical protein
MVWSLLAKVFRAETGNSMSINMRSWLKRLSVTPVSVVAKNAMGELFVLGNGFTIASICAYLKTALRSFQWKATPERGTIVTSNCLGMQSARRCEK